MRNNYWIVFVGMATSFILTVAILLFYMRYRRNLLHQKYLLQETELEHQKALLQTVVKAQEEERKRIAVALHDDTGNRLTILSLLLENMAAGNAPTTNLNEFVAELISSVRGISHSLYPVNLERVGLILYSEELVGVLQEKLTVSFHVSGTYCKRETLKEVQLFRIIQEFSSNVLKHAEASHMDISLRESAHGLFMVLSDNGKSFDLQKARRGMGLRNIQARIESLNATYKWKCSLGRGTRLFIHLPYDKVSHS
jgi:signal transduction histidine kinase